MSTPARRKLWNTLRLAALAPLLLVFGLAAQDAEVPVVKGELGPCTADFTITHSADKPIYNAKIHVAIAYGFMSKRKTDLEVGTNADGKARFEGLPDKVKKPPLEFTVRYGGFAPKTVRLDPATQCQASFKVSLSSQ